MGAGNVLPCRFLAKYTRATPCSAVTRALGTLFMLTIIMCLVLVIPCFILAATTVTTSHQMLLTPFISSHPTVNYAHAPAKQQAMSLSPTRRQPPRGSSSSPPSSPGIRYSTVAPRPTTRLPFEGEEDDDEDEKEDTGSGARDGGKGRGGDRRTRHVQVQALVEKRTLNLDYIRRVHDGA